MHDDAFDRLERELDEEREPQDGPEHDASSSDPTGADDAYDDVLPPAPLPASPDPGVEDGTFSANAFRDSLARAREGDAQAASRVYELLYQDLRELAARLMRGQPVGHTLQATALVSEAYLKAGANGVAWKSREHALAVLCIAMRQVLVDHARRKRNGRRAPPGSREPIEAVLDAYATKEIDLYTFHDQLARLAEISVRMASIVMLRVEYGYTMEEIARILDVPKRTVERLWQRAARWLT